ncbi:MAG: hypothetical protein D6785_09555 [Planctomycetota bacterium]|nr:MAG: hypothetical protein D6785_09555 [Planctomycetota bacterium]
MKKRILFLFFPLFFLPFFSSFSSVFPVKCFLFGEEKVKTDSNSPAENKTSMISSAKGEEEEDEGFQPFFPNKKKKDRYGRMVIPDIILGIYGQLFEIMVKGKFGADEELLNLQDHFHLDSFGTLFGGQLDFPYVGGKIRFSFEEVHVKGSSSGPSRNLVLGGQVFEPAVSTISRYQYISFGSSLFFDLVPSEVQGFQASFFLHGQFIYNSLKVSNSKGRRAQVKFSTLVPTMGVFMNLVIIQATPRSPDEVYHPRPFLSFLFQVEGIAFIDYASRRIMYSYLLEGGIRISPASFFDMDFTYRSHAFKLKETDGKKVVENYREGFYFAFTLKF